MKQQTPAVCTIIYLHSEVCRYDIILPAYIGKVQCVLIVTGV